MIRVDQALCAGCGVCVDECPTAAITLVNDVAQVAADLCDGCGACIQVCPNHALTWVAEPVPERVSGPSLPVVVEPAITVIPAESRELLPWRRAIVPAVGGALTWVGREIVPRLAPLALNLLDGALDRRINRRAGEQDIISASSPGRQGRGRRCRRRRGRSTE